MHATRFNFNALKIAVFGTDNFALDSLKALNAYRSQFPKHIQTLELITRHPKPAGRGLKSIKEAPTAEYALTSNIPVLRADTNDEIQSLASRNYNLAVAVSYGKLIPASFLRSLKYGGINVHPSLLPQLRGAAPIHWCLLQRFQCTGVTIQTLHPTKFDHGKILYQSEEIPILPSDTVDSLYSKLGGIGARCLTEVIAKKLYDPATATAATFRSYKPSYAPKIQPSDRLISFDKDSVDDVLLKSTVLGRLYAFQDTVHGTKRLILEDLSKTDHSPSVLVRPGQYLIESDKFIIKCSDGCITAGSLLLQGYAKQSPSQFAKSMKKRGIANNELTELTQH